MKTISLKLPEAVAARLAAMAEHRGTSKSEVVRAALEAYLSNSQAGGHVSALDLAGDLVGCLEGPGDLSFNEKYLEGYGH